ncbi:MAG: hypothetical protein KKC01_03040 [Gammaproteobacteria bacterium]|nr:hypothetical protein [Gammaproteobacteria bacterium]
MPLLSSFEILAESLVPEGILPPTAPNPFAVQGYWVQVSLPLGSVSATQFNLIFRETTKFTQGAGQSALQAQYIDADGKVNIYTQFFASTGNGFLNQKIFAGQTIIYGVQVLPPPPTSDVSLPQAGTGWRGTVEIDSQNPGSLIATPTQRLVYYNSDDITTGLVDAVVYSVPTYTGGTRI